MIVLVTNNPLVIAQYSGGCNIEFLDTVLPGVLIHVRDCVHKGHKLLTHPLAGSIKPNETFYKSVLISGDTGIVDLQSLTIIEESIITAGKFPQKDIPDEYLHDLQMIDLSLIQSTLNQGGV